MSHKPRVVGQPAVTSSLHRVIVSPPHGLMLAWLAALLVARWLMPTEGAAEGLTLWVVQLVLLTAAGRAAWDWRLGEQRVRVDAMDVAIGTLILAHVVSSLAVVFGVGNARAAINLAWEWIGSGVLIWMLRQELTSVRAVRQLCLGLSLTAGVLAGFGLWQHYVGYAELSRAYDRLTSEHDRLVEQFRSDGVSPVTASSADLKRLATLREEMARQQIPIEKEARQSLEQRVKGSREPLGLFALANSFAGLLIVMGLISASRIGGSRSARWLSMLLATMIAYCLLLTKSRTAWVGLIAGIGWGMLRHMAARWQSAEGSARKWPWLRIGISALVGMSLVGVAVLSGGLDRAVLSQARKSWRYRLEFWQGTWATIREHLWIGTGPGNFREHYLAHKLPESSEEIADPHNFVLDVWANAGTLGLIALLVCLALMAREVFQSRRTCGMAAVESTSPPRPPESDWTSPAVWGVGLAFPLCAFGMEFVGHGNDERLWWLGGIWWGVWLIGLAWTRRTRSEWKPEATTTMASEVPQSSSRLSIALEAAIVALLVHLLGAGGIAMPAITQLLWLVWAMRRASSEGSGNQQDGKSPSESPSRGVMAGRLGVAGTALTAVGLCLACLWTAMMPELLARTSMQAGDFEWRRGQIEVAQVRFFEAAQADPRAIEPLERLAEVSFQRWRTAHQDRDFDEAVDRWNVVQKRIPHSSRPSRQLGQAWLARFEQTRNPDDANKSAESFASAVERYPHHAGLLSEWAMACEAAGLAERAREVARRALRQDDINRHAGHSDKYLASPLRSRMHRLAGASDAN